MSVGACRFSFNHFSYKSDPDDGQRGVLFYASFHFVCCHGSGLNSGISNGNIFDLNKRTKGEIYLPYLLLLYKVGCGRTTGIIVYSVHVLTRMAGALSR